MTAVILTILGAGGRIWARVDGKSRSGNLRSGAFSSMVVVLMLLTTFVVAAIGIFLFMRLDYRMSSYSGVATDIGAIVVCLGAIPSALFMVFCRGSYAPATADHAQAGATMLAQLRALLETHQFRVEATGPDQLRARRGKIGGWILLGAGERTWRDFPLNVSGRVVETGGKARLEIQCTGLGGLDVLRAANAETAAALANLDGRMLGKLDRLVPLGQQGVFFGGLASLIFVALLTCSLLSAATIAGLSSYLLPRAMEATMAEVFQDKSFERYYEVLDLMEEPVHEYLRRLPESVSLKAATSNLSAAPEGDSRSDDPSHGIVLAVQQADGQYALILPVTGSANRTLAEALFATHLNESIKPGLQTVGGRPFLRARHTQDWAGRLGVPPGAVFAGLLVDFGEVQKRLPASNFLKDGSELTLFHKGTAIARFTWLDKRVTVAGAPIPDAIPSTSTKDQSGRIAGRWWDGSGSASIRSEYRKGMGSVWVNYVDIDNHGGWPGFAFVDRFASARVTTRGIVRMSLLGGAVSLLGIGIVVLFGSAAVARRVTRPVLQIRDGLQAIADGDYSVRGDVLRRDEIGQLQELVNRTAAELRKRDSMKDLMGKYLSQQVADQILGDTTGASLTGARREVSVLFADVRGFTTYSESHAPELVTKSLNEFFEVMVDVIAGHDGVLDKFIGDGLMVVFGAPVSQEDHARRAVDTALEMHAALRVLNLKRAQRGDEPIEIGIGVNTGVAISGNLGSLKRMEFTVIGDTVNLASRLESSAKHGQILIGQATYAIVKELIEAESLGQIQVKGKREPVDVWLLKGLRPRKSPIA